MTGNENDGKQIFVLLFQLWPRDSSYSPDIAATVALAEIRERER